MLASDRRRQIRELLTDKRSVSVADLAQRFGVTTETVRRDLQVLEKEGLVTRTYGGAYLTEDFATTNADVRLRTTSHSNEKRRIAQLCRGLVAEGDSLFFDGSSTCYFVAEAVCNLSISVVTNNFRIVSLLSEYPNIKLVCLGGEFSYSQQAFYGAATTRNLESYYVDKAFFSCRSLSIDNGIMAATERWLDIYRLAIDHSTETFLVADHAKFNRNSFVRIAGFDRIDAVVTDRPLDQPWHRTLSETGCKVIDDPEEVAPKGNGYDLIG